MPRTAPVPYLQELWDRLPTLQCVVVVGLPGTGKSLLVRELARAAAEAGRRNALLQWDVCRESWDTHPAALTKYPEIDGVTHKAIRVAMGAWLRSAVGNWFATHEPGTDLLVVEAPHIGGRFSELAHVIQDDAEPHLQGAGVLFVVVAPNRELQLTLRNQRATDLQKNGDGYEHKNASPDLLDELTEELRGPARDLGLSQSDRPGYDPELYATLMQHVLRHRRTLVVRPDRLFDVTGSVYTLATNTERLWPVEAQVNRSLAYADSLTGTELEKHVGDWFRT